MLYIYKDKVFQNRKEVADYICEDINLEDLCNAMMRIMSFREVLNALPEDLQEKIQDEAFLKKVESVAIITNIFENWEN